MELLFIVVGSFTLGYIFKYLMDYNIPKPQTEIEGLTFSAGKVSNKELQNLLKDYPDDAIVCIEYCNPKYMSYDKKNNLIKID